MKTIALIFGGQSSEHEISCLTAGEVVKAIDETKYRVVGIGITRSGVWQRYEPAEVAALKTVAKKLPSLSEDHRHAVVLRSGTGLQIATRQGDAFSDVIDVDVVFSLIHGTYGEDGTLQGMLEMFHCPYVGSGVASSAIGMDKHFMKVALQAAGIPSGSYRVIRPALWENNRELALARVGELQFPIFVKPARGGSSVGISRVADLSGLGQAIEVARQYDPKVIVEQGITDAREVECAVLGPLAGGQPRVSCPGEIVVHTGDAFYDYEAKYLPTDGEVDLNIPADLPPEISAKVRDLARRSFEALDCEGLARVDLFVTAQGDVLVNEVNTMPGFTKLSMFPSLWQASGISYRELLTDLIEQALARPVNVNR
uniref:D-alanine--D-alanine ligase family protein n=1 Tax=Vaginimicrobium propionicum TaxID=1871034 RepID=UPI0009712F12|nr:D-alanine--D-alanine ligase family protein [Vaginimicrobium propionicum]